MLIEKFARELDYIIYKAKYIEHISKGNIKEAKTLQNQILPLLAENGCDSAIFEIYQSNLIDFANKNIETSLQKPIEKMNYKQIMALAFKTHNENVLKFENFQSKDSQTKKSTSNSFKDSQAIKLVKLALIECENYYKKSKSPFLLNEQIEIKNYLASLQGDSYFPNIYNLKSIRKELLDCQKKNKDNPLIPFYVAKNIETFPLVYQTTDLKLERIKIYKDYAKQQFSPLTTKFLNPIDKIKE